MNITKFEHACIVLEEQGQKLVIDPGGFTPAFGDPAGVVAVVVTHEHTDHFDPANLNKILDANPDVQFFVAPEVAEKFQKPGVSVPKAGETYQAGPFRLSFYGEYHATIFADMPPLRNLGVLVNDHFYYPGDSFTKPDKPVGVLAVPACAPWMKISEAMEFIAAVKPGTCVPTHNAILSDSGQAIYNRLLSMACEQVGAGFTYLQPGQSLNA